MKRTNFTAERVASFKCEPGKQQTIFWDGKAPGLGLRATRTGAKSYIFETRLHGKTLRLTIGDPRTWTISKAQAEATRYKTLTDQGIDPRRVREEMRAAQISAERTAHANAKRDAVTLGDIWREYVAERAPLWSAHHLSAHHKIIQLGGEKRTRSPRLTAPGPLAQFATMRMVDITTERVEAWARAEVVARPSSARLAMRLLKACLNWCSTHPTYAAVVTTNPAKSSKARETLGKSKVKSDVLQRQQLGAWFDAVRQIGNPVISAYLQCLLLTGARREEMAKLRWVDVDFQWNSMKLSDKIEDFRMVPLTPYVSSLLGTLPRRNEWVFSSTCSESGRLAEPRIAHNEALARAGLPPLTLHGLRRSFASLCEWIETPTGISAQIQGHAPQGVREQNYIRRPLDLLRMWHIKIEAWMLEEACTAFPPLPIG
ncbi:integrase family protein [Massilia sp. R2A-15]|uniref:tyrosine-type recombinase/integrase n=1 Tax=Massilia sp. R2A-15 TaxID=3064278 RepID=UPI0027369D13|nr:integrase family protein [Massilia sp. R2A-15]WLI89220.1 integrase family protein [Massilia sp. R2A-15]